MAKPLSASRLVEILRAKGVTVHEVRNWRTHNRNAKGPWGPMNGVMIHHTVTSGTDSSVGLCYDGYAPPPGPLCHGVIDKKWHVHMVGNGRGMRSRIANRLRGTPGGGGSDPGPSPGPSTRRSRAPVPSRSARRDPLITAMGKPLAAEG
ncbi:hypothetical protein [Streptomyces chartreusis]|uniref:hypothetical protein n=1 Tax=Streptomyces chartreusis TaxID=1969 RepID=UPI0037D95700